MRRWIIWLMRCSRSDDRPTSSGFTVGEDAVTAVRARTAETRKDETALFMMKSPAGILCDVVTDGADYGRGAWTVQ